ncbi:MAG TPA: glycosyltransferase family 1 protein [Nanoarchaeota archaeon]|nr:glycosyltransferase family 1 protein [Nanoarchaeota archaeon]
MKVLMLSWEFPPKIIGGLGVVVYNIVKHLLQKNVKIKIALPFDPENKEFNEIIISVFKKIELKYSVYESLIFDEEKPKGKNFFDIVNFYAKRVAKICKHLDFDIIHAHDWLTFKAAMELKKITKKPFIAHVHSTEFDRAGGKYGNPKVHEIEYYAFHYADKIIAVSKRVKNWIVNEYYVNPEKIEVVYNAVENIQNNINKKHGRVVLYVGRLSLMKGPDYFLKAAKKVLEKEKAYFVIVGEGEMMHQLMEEACALGIADRILFTGFIDRETLLNKFYSYADVLVMPSISEPFGITALEAIANKVPVIVSKQSGVTEVIKNCLKVDFWDVNEMANKIIAILKYKPLKDMLVENSLEELKNLSWEKQVEKIMKIYYSLKV